MGYKHDDKCIQRAFNDEKLFVLMTRDPSAARLVIEWIKENLTTQPREKLLEALDCALEMANRCNEFIERKTTADELEAKQKEIEFPKAEKERCTCGVYVHCKNNFELCNKV